MTARNKIIACSLMKRFKSNYSFETVAGMILAGIYGEGDSEGVTLNCVKDYMNYMNYMGFVGRD